MCGIAGIVGSRTEAPATLARLMADCLRHRGPDDEGYLTFHDDSRIEQWAGRDTARDLNLPLLNEKSTARVVLAHRRLSILDLSSAGHQPMCDEARRYWLVFNGEIYNYVELRRELTSLGHRFKSGSDTEVLLAALQQWEELALKRLRGMFAFVALDTARHELLLARDPFGIKPLYHARTSDGSFAFASEMKALAVLPGVSRAVDPQSIYQFLRFGLTDNGDRTVFNGIRQLPPGSWMRVPLRGTGQSNPVPFWSMPRRDPVVSDAGAAGALVGNALRESVALHMRSDVPVGSCLSGGLDSTSIVAIASALMPPTSTFGTVSFVSDDPLDSDGPYVAIAERFYRVDSTRVELSAHDIRSDISSLVKAQDAPFGSLSIYAQYAVFRAAKSRGLTVMLDGQGSDELLGGYNTGVSAAIAQRIAHGHLLSALRLANSFDPIGARAHRRTILSALGRFVPARFGPLLMRAVNEPLSPPWLDASWFAERGVRPAVRPQGRGRDALDEELRLFATELSLPQLLRFEDRNSMAFGIESRVPFCDIGFAKAAAAIPASLLITDKAETKAPLRTAFRGAVPNEIIDRRKVGFNTPDRSWLTLLKPWLQTILQERARTMPFLRLHGDFLDCLDRSQGHSPLPPGVFRVISTLLWADTFDVEST
jgi:asparagine synthase (glutamine-hydrolysing)